MSDKIVELGTMAVKVSLLEDEIINLKACLEKLVNKIHKLEKEKK